VVSILADPQARQVPMQGGEGRVVVTDSGDAALVTSVPAAPAGKTYEVWVFEGETPRAAGTFDGNEAHDVVRLTRQVPPGAKIAVTVEADGGVDAPTSPPVMSAAT
jgi:hypothetical protein